MNVKNLSVEKDAVSEVLRWRWIACYMLYDWNYSHADNAFDSNEKTRYEKVMEQLGEDFTRELPLNQKVTKLYNTALVQDIEDFIQRHMEVWNSSRNDVELEITRAMAELL